MNITRFLLVLEVDLQCFRKINNQKSFPTWCFPLCAIVVVSVFITVLIHTWLNFYFILVTGILYFYLQMQISSYFPLSRAPFFSHFPTVIWEMTNRMNSRSIFVQRNFVRTFTVRLTQAVVQTAIQLLSSKILNTDFLCIAMFFAFFQLFILLHWVFTIQ